jgi:flagellar capping protein FliD
MKPYVQTAGIITMRINAIESQIKSNKTRIADLDTQLDSKRQDLKEKYSAMDSAYNQMEQMTQQLSGLNSGSGK